MDLFLLVLVLAVGFVMGYLSKGVTINVNHTPRFDNEEYNEPVVDNLDPEVRNYLDQTQGNIKY